MYALYTLILTILYLLYYYRTPSRTIAHYTILYYHVTTAMPSFVNTALVRADSSSLTLALTLTLTLTSILTLTLVLTLTLT